MEAPRTQRLNLRLSDLEMDLIIQAAAEVGVTPTAFIREAAGRVAKRLLATIKRSTRQ